MSFWSAVGSWAMGQFTSNFLGGKSGGGNGSGCLLYTSPSPRDS